MRIASIGKTFSITTLTAFAALTVACDDNDGGGSGTVAPDQLYETISGAYCSMFKTCSFDNEDTAVVAIFARATSAAHCATFLTDALSGGDLDIEAEVAAGRVVIDQTKFNACRQLVAQRCSVSDVPECQDVFHGTIAVGQPCEHTEHCVADAYCDFEPNTCGGTCKARVAVGEACTGNSSECSSTAGATECDFDSSKCVSIVFETATTAGAECGEFIKDGVSHHVRCSGAFQCTYDEANQKDVCQQLLASGAVCASEGPSCPFGEFCIPTGNGNERKCTALQIVSKEGDACNIDAQNAAPVACNIMERLACVEGKCKKLGDGSLGSFCDTQFDIGSACNDGLYCVEGACTAQKDDGAECDSSRECKSGICGFSDNTSKCLPDECQ